MLESPEWDPALWVWLHQSGVEGRDHVLLAILGPQQTRIPITFSGRAQRLLVFKKFGVHKDTQVPFDNTAFEMGDVQPMLVCGIVSSWVQHLALSILEFHKVLVSPFAQLVGVPLAALQCVVSTTPPKFVSSVDLLRVHTLYPIIWTIIED